MMTHSSHSNSSPVLDRHRDSMMDSLNHRLAVARETNNASLIQLLESEKQQISQVDRSETSFTFRGIWAGIWQRLIHVIQGYSELQVYEFVNGRDRWWYSFDPATGNCVYADSEAELRLWIKQNYQGR